tara:strand:- start:169 stop:426 length:258 start_codon:yes stop_codon:yes gene_type:complete
MESLSQDKKRGEKRRQRLHEILIALIHREDELELLDANSPGLKNAEDVSSNHDPAKWLNRNRRILNKYHALVRSAVTLDALLDTE